MSCEKCKSKTTNCMICEKDICRKCDAYTKYKNQKYCLFCDECKIYQCKKCSGTFDQCIKCNIFYCDTCDDGLTEYGYGGDLNYCREHRPITTNELYEYIVRTYDEKLTLNEIEDNIKNLKHRHRSNTNNTNSS